MIVTQQDIDTYHTALSDAERIQNKFWKRVEEIQQLIVKCFDYKGDVQYCYKPNYNNTVFDCLNFDCEGTIPVTMTCRNRWASHDDEGLRVKSWGYQKGFPKTFLTMTNAQIKAILTKEIEEYSEQQALDAVKKLTPAQRNYLKKEVFQ